MNKDKLARFVELQKEKRELDDALKNVKRQLDELEPLLLEQMTEEGIQSVKVNGLTLYLKRQLWAGAADGNYDAACDALIAEGLAEFVQRRFNTNTVSAYVRELEKAFADNGGSFEEFRLPGALDGAISVAEKFTIGSRKA